MSSFELVKTESELSELSDLLLKEARTSGKNVVSRCMFTMMDSVNFYRGKKTINIECGNVLNKEVMNNGSGIYTMTGCDLNCDNFKEATVARDLQELRFNFMKKPIDLPADDNVFIHDLPSNIDFYDNELRDISMNIKESLLSRVFLVKQKVIVNSEGGRFIQSIPYFRIRYMQGLTPLTLQRNLLNVCESDTQVKNITQLIKYFADPTPDRIIRNSKSLSEAFSELHNISGLRYGGLEHAGIELKGLYDVLMLSGIPVHEIFGHHFEEPIRMINFGESGTFKLNQSIGNDGIKLVDNPYQEIEGLKVLGFTHFDAYGRKREPMNHIIDGKVTGFLGSEYADLRNLGKFINVNQSFIGNAVQDDACFPQARMSCTVLDGKTENVDSEGMIVIVPNGGYTNPQDKTYLVNSSECYIIKKGDPKRLVSLKVTGGINQALYNMSLVNDWTYETGTCGKPDEVTKAQASADVSQYCRNQVWKQQQVYTLPLQENHLKILFN